MSRRPFDPSPNGHPGPPPPKPDAPIELEIDTARARRWRGTAAYLLLFAAVAGLLVYGFVQFTASFAVAIFLVAFMLGYMLLMAKIANADPPRGGRRE